MANWAQIDDNNIVTKVLVTDNNEPDEGYQWLIDNLGGTWIQTSYNSNIRKNFAGVGYRYDSELDAFIGPQPFASWVLDSETCQWGAPVPKPDGDYTWDEETGAWIEDAFNSLD